MDLVTAIAQSTKLSPGAPPPLQLSSSLEDVVGAFKEALSNKHSKPTSRGAAIDSTSNGKEAAASVLPMARELVGMHPDAEHVVKTLERLVEKGTR